MANESAVQDRLRPAPLKVARGARPDLVRRTGDQRHPAD